MGTTMGDERRVLVSGLGPLKWGIYREFREVNTDKNDSVESGHS